MKQVIYLVIVLLIGMAIGFSVKPSLTGYVSVSGGETTSLGQQQKGNPNYGAVKGYVSLVIQDPDTGVISTSPANNVSVYAVRSGTTIGNWSRVKDTETNIGGLENVDGDGSGTRCTSNSYITDKFYNDVNDNGSKDDTEDYMYHVFTDSNGCFALMLPSGTWDIYT